MEKIYMEKNSEKQSLFSKIAKSSVSVKCSFALAFVAIFSILFSGIGANVSYAIPEVTNKLPDSFKTDAPVGLGVSGVGENGQAFNVQRYYTEDGKIQVFCLEHDKGFAGGATYKKGDKITDYGLLYLMANSYPNKTFYSPDGAVLDETISSWITQISIWIYQKEVGANNNTTLTDTDLETIKTVKYVSDEKGGVHLGGDVYLYAQYIEPLVKASIANKNVPNKTFEMTIASKNISLTADEKYYRSDLITVTGTPSDNFNGYSLTINEAPEGTKIIGEDGNEITDFTNLTSTTKFYVKVPVDKITNANKIVKLSTTGSFTTYEGYMYYVDGDSEAQTITSVDTVNNNLNKGLEVPFDYTPDVPDTGMNIPQSLYFVGLLILLAGVGIIYANVKPKQEQ